MSGKENCGSGLGLFIDSLILKRQAEITLKYLDKRKESPLIISVFFSKPSLAAQFRFPRYLPNKLKYFEKYCLQEIIDKKIWHV